MNAKDFSMIFISVFGKDLSRNDIKRYRIGFKEGYLLWNIFGHKLFPSLEGDYARKAYDTIDKQGAFEIHLYWNNIHQEMRTLQSNHDSSQKIDAEGLTEFYVISKNYDWVYVVTHEMNSAGPYFAKLDK